MALSHQAPATRASLLYITGGSVLIVWTVVWLIYLLANSTDSGRIYYVVFGLLATGIVLLYIGLRLGSIGRAAKQAETPPPATPLMPQPLQTATQAPIVVQAQPQVPVGTLPQNMPGQPNQPVVVTAVAPPVQQPR